MGWFKADRGDRELKSQIRELKEQIKDLESKNRQLNGQITILKAVRDLMNQLFYTMADCAVITDEKGRIMKVNQRMQELIGYRESEIAGKDTVEIAARVEEALAIHEELFHRLADKQDVENFDGHLQHKDGTEIPVSSSITFARDESGKQMGAVAIVRRRT